ncbi:MAG TPA: mechanosensitive ion channel family protein [Methylomusa anaerophila]|uniref:Small-conductance mechanosensitive channel n=1 Tax=Methylomusa anaerophila TaxID=1930071 RepID=A0A348AK33_9FIRM|nr:mechanosensitive ion channel family protein [Methylomusa anaerophila]BBB91431.1 small-conductance mechanosensitive channel [Methylomusa anaerophila]HML90146.1 mechanosensitive ion channel family protein [Methylomusa anaerophila]
MLEFFTEIGNRIINGSFETHLVVYFICLALGIIILRLVFSKLLKIIARLTNISYFLLQQTFRGIPTLLGILIGLYAAMEILTIPPRPLLFLQRLFHSLVILSLTLMVAHLCSGYLKYKLGKTSENFASTSILITTIDLTVYAIGILVLLESFGVSISPLITALGVGGLATALALQDTLANLISGINILVSKQIKMGDFVKLSTGEEGHVVDMNWRNTTIKSPSENMVVVPNQKIASSIITNYAQPFAECSVAILIGVSYESDMDYVEKVTVAVAKEILQETAGGVKSFEPLVRYFSFAESSINFNVILRVKNVTDQHLIRHEFMKRLHARYQQEGIIIPFPPERSIRSK